MLEYCIVVDGDAWLEQVGGGGARSGQAAGWWPRPTGGAPTR
jgi:hypothetical protein